MLNQINNAVHLSEMSERILIIDTIGGAFDNDFNKYFYIPNKNYFTNYEILKSYNLYENYKKLIRMPAVYKNGCYFLNKKSITLTPDEILNSNDEIIFFSYLPWYSAKSIGKKSWVIKVKKEILEKIENIQNINNNLKSEYIGVHYRNTDMKSDFSKIYNNILKYLNEIKTIYLSTDDSDACKKFIEFLPKDVIIVQYTKPFDAHGKNIHYGNPDKDEVIMNALIDMYYLKKSKYFIGSQGSSFSERVKIIREKIDEFFQ